MPRVREKRPCGKTPKKKKIGFAPPIDLRIEIVVTP